MTTDVVTVSPDTTVADVAKLLLDRHISAVPVVDGDGKVVGMLSEGDLLRRAETGTERRRSWWLWAFTDSMSLADEYTKAHGKRAREVMSRHVVTIGEEMPLADVADLLERHHVKRVPVVRDGKLAGVVSRADLLRGLATAGPAPDRETAADDRTIREQIMTAIGDQPWTSSGRVSVTVEAGVARLWGLVNSDEERRALHALAENVPGVRSIEDNLGRIREWPWVD